MRFFTYNPLYHNHKHEKTGATCIKQNNSGTLTLINEYYLSSVGAVNL